MSRNGFLLFRRSSSSIVVSVRKRVPSLNESVLEDTYGYLRYSKRVAADRVSLVWFGISLFTVPVRKRFDCPEELIAV